MDLEKCVDCGATGMEDDFESCDKCQSPLCESCGTFTFGKIFCRECVEQEEVDAMNEEINADFDYTPEGCVKVWSEDEQDEQQSRT